MYSYSLMRTLFFFFPCGHTLKPYGFIIHLITKSFKPHGIKKIPTSAPKNESIFISILIYFDSNLQLIINKCTMKENIFC